MKNNLLILFLSASCTLSAQRFFTDSLEINSLIFGVSPKGGQVLLEKSMHKPLVFYAGLLLAGMDSSAVFGSFNSYRNTSELVSGPITTDPNHNAVYNRVWKINKTTVDSFAAGLYGTNVPASIANWPAHGRSAFSESFYLAPFVDVNGNGYYNPQVDGDYPCFPGDQAIFFMHNDDTVHAVSGASIIGLEVLGMAYAYHQNTFLDSVVFVNYTIRNKTADVDSFYIAKHLDFDLGNATDDIVGTFVDQNAVIAYNADNDDEGTLGFGLNPPATGLVVRQGINTLYYDGLDNNKDGCIDGVRDTNGVCVPIDTANGVFEPWKLSNSMSYQNSSSAVMGNPETPIEYFNYMHSLWRNGDTLFVETPSGFLSNANGDGFIPGGGGAPTNIVFPGNTYDTAGAFVPAASVNWFQSPGSLADQRVIAGMGNTPIFKIGTEVYVQTAFFMAQGYDTSHSYNAAYSMARKINAFVDSVPNCSGSFLVGMEEENSVVYELRLSPNPASNSVHISLQNGEHASGEIVNAIGQTVQRFMLNESGQSELHVEMLPAGVYFVKVAQQCKKLIISR